MEKISGAQALLKSLINENVDIIFGYPGGAIMPIYDALYDVQHIIRHILVRHEQGAVHAAEGYARKAGKAGVCFATSGPGATNLITGIADAMLDSIPVVCITGQIPSYLLGSDAFQEANIISMTTAITKWNYQIVSAAEIPFAVAKAFYIAQTGRPGPVLLDITKDAQFELLDFSYKKYTDTLLKNKKNIPISSQLQNASDLINNAKKPYLLVGQGVTLSRAEQQILSLAEKADIPVACTLLGLSAFPCDHPLYVGMLGMHGNYGANILTNEADVIIAVGMRFDDRVTGNLATYARQAKIIHIEIDPGEINKNVHADVPLLGNAKEILELLLPHVCENKHTAWHEKFKKCKAVEYETVIAKECFTPPDKPFNAIFDDSDEEKQVRVGAMDALVHEPTERSFDEVSVIKNSVKLKMGQVVYHLSKKTNGEAVIVTDVGQHQMITARYYQFKNKNSHITSGGLGTMGFALPAAIGAKFAAPESEVIAIIGDGGFQMNIQELAVLMQEKHAVKIIILNNNYLGMVRQWQELFFSHRYSFTSLANPDFIKIAEGYHIKARKAQTRSELDEYLNEMLAVNEPYLLEVVVQAEENVFPMIPSGCGVGEVRLK